MSVFTFLNIVSFYYIITGRNIEDAVRRSVNHMIIAWILLWIVAAANLVLTGSAEKAMHVFVQMEEFLNTTRGIISETQQQLV
ncbi:MAG: hypothetical protein CMM25_02965 [Rhodospirillaceae bacterium]|mgnify:CR=1 FL=1|nr:hypothetical protein [Rhodospirillaceae bacterium]